MFKFKNKNIDRYKVLIIIMAILFTGIVSRLFYLQIYRNEDFKDKANARSARLVPEKAPRGKIYDSNLNLLATNVQTYALTYTETDKANKNFYETAQKVFKTLDQYDEKQLDNFDLKLNDDGEWYFDFTSENSDELKSLEIRFKRDRGLNDEIKYRLFKGKTGDLNDAEENQINEELLKISPEETFNKLLKAYGMYDCLGHLTEKQKKEYEKKDADTIAKEILNKYDKELLRKFMIIKDAIKMQSFSGYKPVNIASNIKKETSFIFLQKLNDMPGIDISLEPMRDYPYGNLGSSILGYISSINPDKKEKYETKGYDASTDFIGMSGIESSFENILKGTKGGTTIKINREGRKVDELFKLEPSPGQNVVLTIDKNVQNSAEQMLAHQLKYLQTGDAASDVNTRNATRGAVVAIEIKTGRVLALASMPNFDPNIFAKPGLLTPEISKEYFNGEIDDKAQKALNNMGSNISLDEAFPKDKNGNRQDPNDVIPKPMFNYATNGLIPPGSTFKPLTAIAGIDQGVIDGNTTVHEKMYFDNHPDVFGKAFRPKDNKTHATASGSPEIDVRTAIAVSCNNYFYEAGYRMYMKNGQNKEALDIIANYAWKAGLGVDPKGKARVGTGLEINENFGQTYNFESFKKQTLLYVKFDLVKQFESGAIGAFNFAPLDIAFNDDDSDQLKEAKTAFKDTIIKKLNEVGNEDFSLDDKFKDSMKECIENLKNTSSKYKENIREYENKGKKDSFKNVYAAVEQFIGNKKAEITTPAQLVYASIGQGLNIYTPVQIANYIATIANGGDRYKVHLVDKITNTNGDVVKEFKPEVVDKMNIPQSTLDIIKQGMTMTNNSEEGTSASVFKGFPITTAGKTGTASFKDKQESFGRTDYGVYVSFAPVDDPQVAVCTEIYDGGHGYFGAPVARAIYETYFKDKIKEIAPNYKPSFQDGGTYDFSLNPSLNNYKDSGVFAPDGKQISKETEEDNKKN